MKPPDDLDLALEDMATLLRCCGEDSKAAWVDERRGRLARGSEVEDEKVREAVRKVLSGMGSFSDLYLQPTAECDRWRPEVERHQRELLARLDVLTGGRDRSNVQPRMIRLGQSSTDLRSK